MIDKPAGPTSHTIVNMVRRLTNEKRVGHAGTLDPFATGLLIVGVGRPATREFSKLVGMDKTYVGTMVLGATSDTQDGTGVITKGLGSLGGSEGWEGRRGELEKVFERFVGLLKQIPPMYSAKKVGGKKLYELARQGKEIVRQPSDVTIYSLSIVNVDLPRITFEVRCSSGTYIRTLAHDIGQNLGCGAYLESLRRTSIGPWTIDQAVKLDSLTKENVQGSLLAIQNVIPV